MSGDSTAAAGISCQLLRQSAIWHYERNGTASLRNGVDPPKTTTTTVDYAICRHAVLFESDIFNNPDHVGDGNGILTLLEECGYDGFLVYGNFRYLMGKYSLSDRKWFKRLLIHQYPGDFYYFGLLFMQNGQLGAFYNRELDRQTNLDRP